MSQLISIGSSEHIDFIRNKLEEEGKLLLAEGVVLKFNERTLGGYTFWGLNVPTTNNGIPLGEGAVFSLRYLVAKLLADLIASKYENQLVTKLVKGRYQYFGREEQMAILSKTNEILNNHHVQRRRNYVLQSAFEYLETGEVLILDGFVRFRLKNYLEELSDAVVRAVDEYLMEKEYNDFVKLLKYFVDIQEPKVEKVHVLLQENGFFQLYDNQDNEIKNDYLESFIIELADNELNYEDLLISTLITLAPREIIIHLPGLSDNHGTVSTIESVFDERVCLCAGCSKCIRPGRHQKKP